MQLYKFPRENLRVQISDPVTTTNTNVDLVKEVMQAKPKTPGARPNRYGSRLIIKNRDRPLATVHQLKAKASAPNLTQTSHSQKEVSGLRREIVSASCDPCARNNVASKKSNNLYIDLNDKQSRIKRQPVNSF